MSQYYHKPHFFADYNKLMIIGGTKNYDKHIEVPRLLVRRTGNYVCATYSDTPALVESTIYMATSDKINLVYLLGLLNSQIMTFYLHNKLMTNAQGFPQVLMGQLHQLPIKILDLSNNTEKTQHDEIVKQVDLLLKLNEQLKNERDKVKQKRLLVALFLPSSE